MRYVPAVMSTFLMCTILAVRGACAQDSTAANIDSLRLPTDSAQVQPKKERPLKKFKKTFRKLIRREKDENKQPKDHVVTDPELNLRGFVLDKTRSRAGRTFYELFYRYWQPPEDANYYTITISEKPTPWRGTRIIITMNYQQILQFPLRPDYHYIEKVSRQAVKVVYRKLKKQSSIEDQLIF